MINTKNLVLSTLAMGLIASLTACGGGGGGSDHPNPNHKSGQIDADKKELAYNQKANTSVTTSSLGLSNNQTKSFKYFSSDSNKLSISSDGEITSKWKGKTDTDVKIWATQNGATTNKLNIHLDALGKIKEDKTTFNFVTNSNSIEVSSASTSIDKVCQRGDCYSASEGGNKEVPQWQGLKGNQIYQITGNSGTKISSIYFDSPSSYNCMKLMYMDKNGDNQKIYLTNHKSTPTNLKIDTQHPIQITGIKFNAKNCQNGDLSLSKSTKGSIDNSLITSIFISSNQELNNDNKANIIEINDNLSFANLDSFAKNYKDFPIKFPHFVINENKVEFRGTLTDWAHNHPNGNLHLRIDQNSEVKIPLNTLLVVYKKGIDTQDIASCQAELNKVNQRLKNNLIHQVQAFVGHSKAMQNQDKSPLSELGFNKSSSCFKKYASKTEDEFNLKSTSDNLKIKKVTIDGFGIVNGIEQAQFQHAWNGSHYPDRTYSSNNDSLADNSASPNLAIWKMGTDNIVFNADDANVRGIIQLYGMPKGRSSFAINSPWGSHIQGKNTQVNDVKVIGNYFGLVMHWMHKVLEPQMSETSIYNLQMIL
ncbi:hypothetical protein CF386_12440 [Paraphotobacterium marinum]|uniref:Uncharacterized protein n=1 Tax=Paraphotobacterium marinum TaxID=1755811 RepID=A0A220VHR4_9GAMM|nr:hypothetical protein [Paraphotobacterium marinum]ASK79841.1 hypothetical protein CF386_12440 [Paraphotobacterium marinum]